MLFPVYLAEVEDRPVQTPTAPVNPGAVCRGVAVAEVARLLESGPKSGDFGYEWMPSECKPL
jgi:hypothetical protein